VVRWLRMHQDEVGGVTLMVLVSVATVLAVHGASSRIGTAVAMTVAEVGLLLGRHALPRLRFAGLALAIAAGFTALLLAPSGLAEVPILAAAARLPWTLSADRRRPVTIALGVLFGVGVAYISGNIAGLLAGYGVWLLAQRTVQTVALQAERDRAVVLLAEVEASRDAQAEAAAGAERARIAREMHDVLAHSLAGLSLQLQAVRAVAQREGVGDAVTVPLQRAADLARDGVSEARAAVGALAPAGVEPVGTGPASPGVLAVPAQRGVAAIGELVSAFGGSASLAVTGDVESLSAAAEHAVYRAVQESLTNAARYAPGAPVAVALDWSPTQLVATVSDEGATDRGDLHESVRVAPFGEGTGTGLIGMAERLRQVGGRLVAGPAGDGWLVRIVVPTVPTVPTVPVVADPAPRAVGRSR
jgi:signal transduction histidine kinase